MERPTSSGSLRPQYIVQRLSVVDEVPEEMESAAAAETTPSVVPEKMGFNTTVIDVSKVPSSATTTDLDIDLESLPSSRDGTSGHVPSSRRSRNRINYLRLAAICVAQLTSGLTDSATGTLIPSLEKYYFSSSPSSSDPSVQPKTQTTAHLEVSLLFVGQAFGFVFGAAFGDPIRSFFQRSRRSYSNIFTLANLIVAIAYIPLVVTANPFVLTVTAFFLLGFGNSFNLALGNVFVSQLGTSKLGIMHGMYAAGGVAGPLVANSMISFKNMSWGMYYCVTLGLAILGMVGMGWSFWAYNDGDAERDLQTRDEKNGRVDTKIGCVKAKRLLHWQANLAAIDWSFVLFCALFIFAYQGAEVSISGWAYTFLKEERSAATNFGYATAGFWGGIMLGRLGLTSAGKWVGEKRFVYILGASCFVLQILVWFVKNAIANAVVFAVIGLLLGPVYPCATAVFMRNMDEQQRVTGIGIISAFGMSGGAVAPFINGAIADSCGSWVLNPIAMILYGAMLACWWFVPDRKGNSTATADQEG
ncbi:major facilitator superfamily transporter [Podospora fimiseda]|uniref:Major facilitator superfamily transporter n=1 Tax=Podospora fimiseda TaxID=252190 RepID=A0AAN7BWL7_9PEZI|nr:major facilitator superfamily transporter [Podospora fimiseda]